METRHLIDGIVRQTTVLIAQLATASGIRAPLAHVADQVFLALAQEIEAQGVGRKVVADMFGVALRTYQKKVNRLTESATLRDRTLWEAVLELLTERGRMTRPELVDRFRVDGEAAVGAVLSDLVGLGLVYSTGRGANALFGTTSAADQKAVDDENRLAAMTHLAWLAVHRDGPISRAALSLRFATDGDLLTRALDALVADGRVAEDVRVAPPVLCAETFLVPAGQEEGWEAAVFDHFRTVATAIASKLRTSGPRSGADDRVGGATLSFEVHPGHPHEGAVYSLLERVRADVNVLWRAVEEHNLAHPAPEEQRTKVWFYLGQNVED